MITPLLLCLVHYLDPPTRYQHFLSSWRFQPLLSYSQISYELWGYFFILSSNDSTYSTSFTSPSNVGGLAFLNSSGTYYFSLLPSWWWWWSFLLWVPSSCCSWVLVLFLGVSSRVPPFTISSLGILCLFLDLLPYSPFLFSPSSKGVCLSVWITPNSCFLSFVSLKNYNRTAFTSTFLYYSLKILSLSVAILSLSTLKLLILAVRLLNVSIKSGEPISLCCPIDISSSTIISSSYPWHDWSELYHTIPFLIYFDPQCLLMYWKFTHIAVRWVK